MKQLPILLLFLLIFQTSQTLITQNISNEGTGLRVVFPTHDNSRIRGTAIDLVANFTVFINVRSCKCKRFAVCKNYQYNFSKR